MSADAGRLSEPQRQVLLKMAGGRKLERWQVGLSEWRYDWEPANERAPSSATIHALTKRGLVREVRTSRVGRLIVLTDAGRRVAEGK